jgi:hypothetical protein
VTANHTISVTFSVNPVYTITPTAGPHGLISPAAAWSVTSGGSVTFSFFPDAGYQIATLLVDGVPASVGIGNTYTFSNVTANHTIAVTFELTPVLRYTITSSAGAHGSISPVGVQTLDAGANQTFTIAPNGGYQIATVTVDGASVGALTSYTFFNVNANHTISVSFTAIPTFTITPTAGLHGSISPATPWTVTTGGSVTFSFFPDNGYHVATLTVDGAPAVVGLGNTYTFSNVTANHTISVTFAPDSGGPTFTLAPTAGPHGSISPATTQTVNSGASQTFTFTPAGGYQVATVTVDGASVGAASSYTFSNVTASHTISVTFARIPVFTITPTAGPHGSISPATPWSAASGSSVTFSFFPDSGYHVATLTVDGAVATVGIGNTYTFNNVTADHTISVTFAVDANAIFTITPSAGPHGAISPATVTTVTAGGSQTFTFTPNSGYQVATLLIDGSPVEPAASYTFSDVAANHTIAVTFAPLGTFTIAPSAGAHGSISPSTFQAVISGDSITFTMTPDSGYHVGTLLIDGSPVTPATSYTFTNVTANHTILVSFASNAAVRTTISLRASGSSFRLGKYIGLSAVLSGGVPAGTLVRFEIRKPGTTRFVTLQTRAVNAAGSASAKRYKLTKRGTYYFRVRFLGNAGFAASTSSSRKVVVR